MGKTVYDRSSPVKRRGHNHAHLFLFVRNKMNTKLKKCLFGGALIGAGLCSSAAADFTWIGAGNSFHAENLGAYNHFSPVGGWDESSSTGTSYSSTVGTELGLSMLAYAGSTDIAFVAMSFMKAFTVTEDMTVTIEWDFRNDQLDGISDSFFDVYLDGTNIFHAALTVAAMGSETLDLYAGITYDWRGLTMAGASGLTSVSMHETTVNVVPLPPAAFAGLGMLAGLGAYRRVRR